MEIKIIFGNKNGSDWNGPGFESTTHFKPILNLNGPYPIWLIFT